jgi:CheY-like chemotaxis protein
LKRRFNASAAFPIVNLKPGLITMNDPQKGKYPRKELIVNKNGPVIIIEDDEDDQAFLTEIFERLDYQNQIIFFSDGEKALDYITNLAEKPFLILSDINMPKLSGFALRDKLKTDAKLSNKCIPYLFFSTALSQKAVIDAYSKSVQGFFVKQTTMSELEKTITVIMEYWRRCAAPNDFPE